MAKKQIIIEKKIEDGTWLEILPQSDAKIINFDSTVSGVEDIDNVQDAIDDIYNKINGDVQDQIDDLNSNLASEISRSQDEDNILQDQINTNSDRITTLSNDVYHKNDIKNIALTGEAKDISVDPIGSMPTQENLQEALKTIWDKQTAGFVVEPNASQVQLSFDDTDTPYVLKADIVSHSLGQESFDSNVNTLLNKIEPNEQNIADLQTTVALKATKVELNTHIDNTNNPHQVTKAQVGLENVDNTSDMNKPISYATLDALDLKANQSSLTSHISDTNNPHQVTKVQVGLSNVNNTSDADKPISTATQTALDAKANNSAVVHKTDNLTETITGDKTFSNETIFNNDIYVNNTSTNLGKIHLQGTGNVELDGNGINYSNGTGSINYANIENISNKVTSISSSSTDTQYPSAKCVYDELTAKADSNDLTNAVTNLTTAINGKISGVEVNGQTVEPDENHIADITVPTKVSDLTNDSGFINNDVNNLTYYTKSSDLNDALALKADLSDVELKSNKVTSISGSSTDTEYPSAKCVYDELSKKVGNNPGVSHANRILTIGGDKSATGKGKARWSKIETGQGIDLDIVQDTSSTPSVYTFKINDSIISDIDSKSTIAETGNKIELTLDSTDYKLTATLKNKNNETISTSTTIDLPLETMVVGAEYVEDSQGKCIILRLKDGSTTRVPVDALVAGLQSEITSTNKLASDLVDDTNQVNKFVTAADKASWSAKYDKPSAGIPKADLASGVQESLNLADSALQSYTETDPIFTASAAYGINASDIEAWNAKADVSDIHNATLTITKNGTALGTFTANASDNTTIDIPIVLPTVNNATLTIKKNGTSVGTFTANASSDASINIVVPTTTNELSNNSGFIKKSVDDLTNYRTSASQDIIDATKANDNTVVHKTGNLTEEISGGKTFTNGTTFVSPITVYGTSTSKNKAINGDGVSYNNDAQLLFPPLEAEATDTIATQSQTLTKINPVGSGSFSLSSASSIGESAVAIGKYNLASGREAFAGGYSDSGNYSTASGKGSLAFGFKNTVSDDYAIALGSMNTTSGSAAFAGGNESKAKKAGSIAYGQAVETSSNTNTVPQQAVFGRYNAINDDAILMIGNGDNGSRKNAFEVLKNGDITASGNNIKLNKTTITQTASGNITLTLPSSTGTIAVTSDIPKIPDNNVTTTEDGIDGRIAKFDGTHTIKNGPQLKYVVSVKRATHSSPIQVAGSIQPLNNTLDWDTQNIYKGYLEVTVNGITNNTFIENIVMDLDLLNQIAPIIKTNTDKLILYFTKNSGSITGTIWNLVTKEAYYEIV